MPHLKTDEYDLITPRALWKRGVCLSRRAAGQSGPAAFSRETPIDARQAGCYNIGTRYDDTKERGQMKISSARRPEPGCDIGREGRRNLNLELTHQLVYTVAIGMIATGYVQSFLLSRGLTAGDYSMISFAGTAMSMLAYFLFTLYRPKNDNYFPTLKINSFLAVLYPLSLLACILLNAPAVLIVMMISTAANSLVGAFKATAGYAVVPHLYPRSEYGPMMAKAGIGGCLIATVVSMIGSSVLDADAGTGGYALFFGIAALSFLITACIPLFYRPLKHEDEAPAASHASGLDMKKLVSRLKDRKFAFRMLPHLIRGVGMASFGYLSLVGITNTRLTASQSGYLVTIGVAAQLIGNFLLLKMSKKLSSGVITLAGMGVQAACLLIMPFVHDNVFLMFAILFIASLASIVGDTGVPMGVVQSTSSDDLPLVSSLRMLACSGTSCLFVLILGRMIEHAAFWALAIGAAAYIAAGLLYWRQFTDRVEK